MRTNNNSNSGIVSRNTTSAFSTKANHSRHHHFASICWVILVVMCIDATAVINVHIRQIDCFALSCPQTSHPIPHQIIISKEVPSFHLSYSCFYLLNTALSPMILVPSFVRTLVCMLVRDWHLFAKMCVPNAGKWRPTGCRQSTLRWTKNESDGCNRRVQVYCTPHK